jgi:hypothetical protein
MLDDFHFPVLETYLVVGTNLSASYMVGSGKILQDESVQSGFTVAKAVVARKWVVKLTKKLNKSVKRYSEPCLHISNPNFNIFESFDCHQCRPHLLEKRWFSFGNSVPEHGHLSPPRSVLKAFKLLVS